jgi:hypothetical protein
VLKNKNKPNLFSFFVRLMFVDKLPEKVSKKGLSVVLVWDVSEYAKALQKPIRKRLLRMRRHKVKFIFSICFLIQTLFLILSKLTVCLWKIEIKH